MGTGKPVRTEDLVGTGDLEGTEDREISMDKYQTNNWLYVVSEYRERDPKVLGSSRRSQDHTSNPLSMWIIGSCLSIMRSVKSTANHRGHLLDLYQKL